MSEQSPAEAIFFAALEKPAEQRAAYLAAACGDDNSLRQRVERLLAAHPQVGSFLEPAAQENLDAPEAPTIPPRESASPSLNETSSYYRTSESVGAVIAGKYKLLEPLGAGGMGAVFMAQQTAPVKRLVALKLILQGMDSRAVLARFEAERQALMDHPNIAKVLDAGATDSGRPYFVMELMKGVPITRFCDERQLSTRERLELFIPVCQAIQHAHQKGVIHRDIKPSNVLVALYDDRPVPKVIDFGVAKATGPQFTDASLVTGFGALVGTPEYMSPEQAQLNQLDIDTRSDVYALGVLLYELLTGTTPIDRKRLGQDALLEILRVIREEEPQQPSTRLSTSEALASIAATRKTEPAKLAKLIRGELDWIVMRCLEKDRSRRYETANGLARDLERYLTDEVVEARPPTAGYRLRKFARKYRTALTTAATIILLLAAGVAVSTWQALRATRAEGVALDEQGRTAEALKVAELNQQTADKQRKKAEAFAASLAVDLDLKHCENNEVELGLLRLAQTLRTTIPLDARELRECTALNILAWGQQLRPAIAALDHDGYSVDQLVLSPDGLAVLSRGRDGTARLWDSLTGKQRAILGEVWPSQMVNPFIRQDQLHFSSDSRIALTLNGRDQTVRLWDVATGRLRGQTARHPGEVYEIHLSQNNSLLVTSTLITNPSNPSAATTTTFAWDPENGRLIGKLERSFGVGKVEQTQTDVNGQLVRKTERPNLPIRCAVSPDGRSVLTAGWHLQGQPRLKELPGGGVTLDLPDYRMEMEVWLPHEASPPKRIPAITGSIVSGIYFSPSGRSAITVAMDSVMWWDTGAWKLQRKWEQIPDNYLPVFKDLPAFGHENLVMLIAPEDGLGFTPAPRVFVRDLPEPITSTSKNDCRTSPDGALVAFDVDEIYDCRNGERRTLPRGHRFDPELRHFTDDGRFALFPNSFLADLAVEKKIGAKVASRFLQSQHAWIGIDSSNGITLVRKSDDSLDAGLLEKWCQVITCGELDERGRYRKLDEPTWEKRRQELSLQLESLPNAKSLRAATTDRLYWLRHEIDDLLTKSLAGKGSVQYSTATLTLLDRLIAAEPTWPNYSQRATAHFHLEHWVDAARDELEAARLAGDRYWRFGSPFALVTEGVYAQSPDSDWGLGAKIVQIVGRPREEYELALRWAEARSRVGIGDAAPMLRPSRTLMISLALFRLERYSDALAMLRERDLPIISLAAGMAMSPWSLMIAYGKAGFLPSGLPGGAPGGVSMTPNGWVNNNVFEVDPVDMIVRAMCYHHLRQPKLAVNCLHQARERLAKEGEGNPEHRALLREAETLIEEKTRP